MRRAWRDRCGREAEGPGPPRSSRSSTAGSSRAALVGAMTLPARGRCRDPGGRGLDPHLLTSSRVSPPRHTTSRGGALSGGDRALELTQQLPPANDPGQPVSLGIVIRAAEGLVLAAESRVTLTAQTPGCVTVARHLRQRDEAAELQCSEYRCRACYVRPGSDRPTYGTQFPPRVEATLPPKRLSVGDFAQHFSDFFLAQCARRCPREPSEPDSYEELVDAR